MLTAIEYLRPVGIGATSPQLFRADDGKVYIVKLQNNRLGPKVLANELLGSKLGERMELCFPPAGIIELDNAVIQKNRRLATCHVREGKHFACQYLSHTEYLCGNNLYKAVNKSEMAGVMLFDHMLHNPDRTQNRRNLLLRHEPEGYRIYAIDNSHLFRGALWTVNRLEKMASHIQLNYRRTYGILLKKFLRPEHFEPYLAKIKNISDDEIRCIIDDLPVEWLPLDADRDALYQFLGIQRDKIEKIVNGICSLIPDKHRGTNRN